MYRKRVKNSVKKDVSSKSLTLISGAVQDFLRGDAVRWPGGPGGRLRPPWSRAAAWNNFYIAPKIVLTDTYM